MVSRGHGGGDVYAARGGDGAEYCRPASPSAQPGYGADPDCRLANSGGQALAGCAAADWVVPFTSHHGGAGRVVLRVSGAGFA